MQMYYYFTIKSKNILILFLQILKYHLYKTKTSVNKMFNSINGGCID
jgi:hypothetical protein